MKKLLVLTGLLTIFSFQLFATHVDENTAKQVGETFLMYVTSSSKKSVNLHLVLSSGLANNNSANAEAITFYYVFNGEEKGFIIVAGDDAVTPILAYSNEVSFDPNKIPPSVQKWLETYKNQIHHVIDHHIPATQEIQDKWISFVNGHPPIVTKASNVSPLLQTTWDQKPYENALCPYDYNYEERTVTGCTATSMAQIMKYWNYPATGTGLHSYDEQQYGTLYVNFGSTAYQWSSMPTILDSPNNAVATLMYHCGVAVEMSYGVGATGGSGSYVIENWAPSVEQTCEHAFKTYFGYDPASIQGLMRSNYTDANWINLLKNELDESRPMQYAGLGSGGHTWVCDGYDDDNFFHMNWGWGGNSNGYFQLSALNPNSIGTGGGSGNYNGDQHALIGIKPLNPTSPQNYNLQLYSDLNMSSTPIWFTSAFSLTASIINLGADSFSGEYGAAIFDENDNFVNWLEIKSGMSLDSNSFYATPLTFSNPGSTEFVPGTYYLALFYKTTTQDWTAIGNGNYTNILQFEIVYSSDIETNSVFTITNNSGRLILGSSASINVDLLNTGGSTFYGQYRVNLSNLDGTLAQTIQILNESNGLANGASYTGGKNFTGNITVAPGTYLLDLAYKTQGSSSWLYAGSTNYSNPIYVMVEVPGLTPDQYENNNTAATAYTFPVYFPENTSTTYTTGSNLHFGTDDDFYKIDLQPGFDYTISARLHDAQNSGNGNTYSVDALFSYSTNGGSSWSGTYTDVMTGDITIQNGGQVYFHVAPSVSGTTGTYLLEVVINRVGNSAGINTLETADLINIYPNPAKEFVHIDLSELSAPVSSIRLLTIQGQAIRSMNTTNEKTLTIPLQGLSDGTYFVEIHSENQTLSKKIAVSQ